LTLITEIRDFASFKPQPIGCTVPAENIRPHIAIKQDYINGRKMTPKPQDADPCIAYYIRQVALTASGAEQLENTIYSRTWGV
jgi:hypothetical protein